MKINDTTELVAASIPPHWDEYYTESYLAGEENGYDDKVVLYIAESSQQNVIKKLEERGYQLKHTTENRRTENTILYYVRQPIVPKEN